MNYRYLFGLFVVSISVPITALHAQSANHHFVFRDVGKERGLIPAVLGIQGHGAGWGDVNGDGWPDLCVGTFHYKETKPNLLFINREGKFIADTSTSTSISTRATGVLLVDLDNDGDRDLYVASMPGPAGSRLANRIGHPLRGCSLFRNDGDGVFKDVSKDSLACPDSFGGRSATVLDFDGDGLLDLLVGEDPIPGYNGSQTRTSRLFRNLGDLRFEDVTRRAGIPDNAAGLGVASADVNLDGYPDIFLASTIGNLLLLNDRRGHFTQDQSLKKVFAWPHAKGDDMVCGVSISDLNNDGLPDVVLGQHFSSPWVVPVPNRIYLNRGTKNGVPVFEDVTKDAGLVPLPLKAPHVEIQDFDNDGRPDIFCSIVKFADQKPYPLIFRNLGNRSNGTPRFSQKALGVNDFPTDKDRAIKRSGRFFEKMIADHKIVYTAPGPTCDFDRDGRLDMFMPSWWPEIPSMLLRNESPCGHWIQIEVEGHPKTNSMGVGSRVEIFEAGHAGVIEKRIGIREIATGYGYASSQETVAHFGLGVRTQCDVVVTLPFDKGKIVKRNIRADQRMNVVDQ